MTSRIRTTAEDEGIQIIEIGETPPDNQNFFEYFEEVVSNLESSGKMVGLGIKMRSTIL